MNPVSLVERSERGPSVSASSATRHVLYLTFDGVLEPLGRSQVLRYLEQLSTRGFAYTLISLERDEDVADTGAVQRLEDELRDRGIRWFRLPYHRGGVRAVVENCRAMYRCGRDVLMARKFDLIHARAHVPAAVAWRLSRATGVPYLFDVRGYWIQEKAAEGRWFTNSAIRAIACRWENKMLRDAAGIATLTDVLADDLRAGALAGTNVPVLTVGTCADFDEFTPDADTSLVSGDVRRRLAGKLVVAWVGAINASYYVAESVRFFSILRELRPDAHLLCITRQTDEMELRLSAAGVAAGDRTIRAVAHAEMPSWLAAAHWGVLLVPPAFSKRGAMPTKLAEFLASGVRPIQYGCNDEVTALVRECGSGIVLEGVSEDDLQKAARQVASSHGRGTETLRARELARPRVGLEHGVAAYARLMESIFANVRQR